MGLAGGASWAWLASSSTGLLVAQVRPQVPGVELRTYQADGGYTTQSWNTGIPANNVAVGTGGGNWAVVWSTADGGLGQRVTCVSSALLGSQSELDAGAGADEVSVAVNGLGGVGIAARPVNGSAGLMAASLLGCPTDFVTMKKPGYATMFPTGVAATVKPGSLSTSDFRFAVVEDIAGFNGGHATFGLLDDGGVESAQYFQSGDRSFDISAAMSGDGTVVMMSYYGTAIDGGWALKVKPMPADYGPPSAAGREVMPGVNVWGSAPCGPACFATVGVLEASPVTLRASFVSADSAYVDLAGGTWDVACARSLTPRNAVTAVAFGRLWVLYTDSTKNELYACDLPPGL